MPVKRLLVVVDMQNDFISGALGTPEAQAALGEVQTLLAAERAAGSAVAFTLDTHGADYLSTQEGRRLPVAHCIRGTKGWELAAGLDARGARLFEKGTFGSVELAEYARAFDEVLLCGVCTDICVVSNALLIKAFSPEAAIYCVVDACAGTSPAAHEAALATMRSCQVQAVSSAHLLIR